MKNIILLVLATILLNSCQNDDDYHYEFPEDEIYFPHDGLYGLNILNESTTEFKAYNDSIEGTTYSMLVSVPFNMSLKIVIENTTPGSDYLSWFWSGGSDFIYFRESLEANDKTDVIIVYGQNVAVTRIGLLNRSEMNSAEIRFYRNEENTPFRTKKITWKP